MLDGHAELEARLGALGRQRLDPALQAAHLRAIETAGVHRPTPPFARVVRAAVLAAIVLLLASTGLAAAGVSAGPVTGLGEKIAGVAGVDIHDNTVTHGTKRHYGPECVPIGDGKGAPNHGQYLKWIRQNRPELLEAAKASNCGKPLADSGEPDDAGD